MFFLDVNYSFNRRRKSAIRKKVPIPHSLFPIPELRLLFAIYTQSYHIF